MGRIAAILIEYDHKSYPTGAELPDDTPDAIIADLDAINALERVPSIYLGLDVGNDFEQVARDTGALDDAERKELEHLRAQAALDDKLERQSVQAEADARLSQQSVQDVTAGDGTDAGDGAEGEELKSAPPFDTLTIAQLEALIVAEGLAVERAGLKKPELVAAILAARAAKTAPTG